MFHYRRNRPSFPVVYTTQGTFIAASFSGTCLICKNKYHHSYYEAEDGCEHFYDPMHTQPKYFMTTSKSAFEIQLLKELTLQLSLASVTFDSQAEVYNAVHANNDAVRLKVYEEKYARRNGDECWRLNVRRLEDAWFLLSLSTTSTNTKFSTALISTPIRFQEIDET